MQPDGGERLPSSGSFLKESREGASAAPSGNPERDKRSCETDMRVLLMLGVDANILPRVWSILFCPPPPPPFAGQNPRPERRFVTKSLISPLKRLSLDSDNR